MLRRFLIAALIAPALSAQTSDQRLAAAWTHYTEFHLADDPGEDQEAGLVDAMDDLGKAWAAWAEG
ncbi:MAG TPA: hypothetical protein VL181_01980, partial [Holophagaceae bacterium]|nr:hypothetical protein [Holophagaceae bacterium]